MSETRARFLREIAARIPAERLVEIHLFPAMRQGAIESAMAVVAATPEPDAAPDPEPVAGHAAPASVDPPATAEAFAESDPPDPADDGPRDGDAPLRRHTVYTARYRATLKGADRGKWEFSLVAEADAPLVTVDAVVRGVQRRSADAAEPERLTPESLRATSEASWPISTS